MNAKTAKGWRKNSRSPDRRVVQPNGLGSEANKTPHPTLTIHFDTHDKGGISCAFGAQRAGWTAL